MNFKYALYTVATIAVIVLVLAIIQGWWALTNAKDLLLAMMSIILIWAVWVEVRLARLQLAAHKTRSGAGFSLLTKACQWHDISNRGDYL